MVTELLGCKAVKNTLSEAMTLMVTKLKKDPSSSSSLRAAVGKFSALCVEATSLTLCLDRVRALRAARPRWEVPQNKTRVPDSQVS